MASQTIYNSNRKKYLIKEILYYLALSFSTGSFVQTFMLAKGIPTHLVATYSAIIQIVQTSFMFFASFMCDKIKNVIRANAVSNFILPIIFIGLLITQAPNVFSNTAYLIILITSIVANTALGFLNILYYKLPYYVIDINDFGKFSAITGMASSGLSFLFTTITSILANYVDFFILSASTFIFATILWILSSIVTALLKDISQGTIIEQKPKEKLPSLLKYPYFYKLIPANILRGICTGIIAQIVVIGTHIGTLNTNLSIFITAITCLSTIIASATYIFLEKRFNLGFVLITSAGIMLVAMPLSVLFNVLPLYIFYFISYLCLHLIANAMPVMVYKYVPAKIMAKYTAWRMLCFTLGCALPGFFIAPLLNSVGAIVLMLLGAGCMFISCLLYMLVFRKATPVEN